MQLLTHIARQNARLERVTLRHLLVLVLTLAACTGRTLAQDSIIVAASTLASPVALSAERTDVPLAAVAEGRSVGASTSVAARLGAIGPGRQFYLRLLNLKADAPPGVTYNVYLNLPANARPQGPSDPHYAGTVSFFNAERSDGADAALNITEHLQRLLARNDVGAGLTVTIVPSGDADPAAAPQIGRVVLTAK